MTDITPRGFTGHEHLDRHGLIHMNGRVYDPRLGRFLQADPFVEDTGTLNRYTYVHNNPLSYSDPSGFFSFKDFARLAFSVTISFYTGGLSLAANTIGQAAAIGAAGGALAGGISAGTWDGALAGAFVGAIAGGLAKGLQRAEWATKGAGKIKGPHTLDKAVQTLNSTGRVAHAAGTGVASGISADLQGGKFGHSFASAIGGAALGENLGTLQLDGEFQFLIEIIAAGTISEVSGSEFESGATTAAFSFALSKVSGFSENDEVAGSRGVNEEAALTVSREFVTTREYSGINWIAANKLVGAEMAAMSRVDGVEFCSLGCPVSIPDPLTGIPFDGWRFEISTINSHIACPISSSCGAMTSTPIHTHGSRRYRVSALDARINPQLKRVQGDWQRQNRDRFSSQDRTLRSLFLYTSDDRLLLWQSGQEVTEYE